jgi:hypothetical protein
VLNQHAIGEESFGNGISRVLLPRAAPVTKGSNDHAQGGVDGCQVKGGEIAGVV